MSNLQQTLSDLTLGAWGRVPAQQPTTLMHSAARQLAQQSAVKPADTSRSVGELAKATSPSSPLTSRQSLVPTLPDTGGHSTGSASTDSRQPIPLARAVNVLPQRTVGLPQTGLAFTAVQANTPNTLPAAVIPPSMDGTVPSETLPPQVHRRPDHPSFAMSSPGTSKPASSPQAVEPTAHQPTTSSSAPRGPSPDPDSFAPTAARWTPAHDRAGADPHHASPRHVLEDVVDPAQVIVALAGARPGTDRGVPADPETHRDANMSAAAARPVSFLRYVPVGTSTSPLSVLGSGPSQVQEMVRWATLMNASPPPHPPSAAGTVATGVLPAQPQLARSGEADGLDSVILPFARAHRAHVQQKGTSGGVAASQTHPLPTTTVATLTGDVTGKVGTDGLGRASSLTAGSDVSLRLPGVPD